MKQISWKEVYEKCNHNKYCQITKVFQKYSIRSSIQNFFKNYGIIFAIIIITFILILTVIFRNNLIIVLYSAILIFLLSLMTIFSSTYKLTLKENQLVVRINMQDIDISYTKLNNIYLEPQKMKIFFIPFYIYTLKVSYFIGKEKLNILSFPIVMLNKKDVLNFFKIFELKAYKNQEEDIQKEINAKKNFYKALAIVIGITFIILFVISLILYFIK